MMAIELNLALFLFNFLPVPPLDGSRIVDGLMPYRSASSGSSSAVRFSAVGLASLALRRRRLPCSTTPIGYVQGHPLPDRLHIAGWS